MQPDTPRDDSRPVLVFIWWPIFLVCVTGGTAVLVAMLSGATFSSGPMPLVIIALIAAGGLAMLPLLVKHTRAQFRGRGFTGFWKSFRKTNWGDGL